MRHVPCSRCGALFEPKADERGITSFVCDKHDDATAAPAAATKNKKKGGIPHALRLTATEAKAASTRPTKPRA